MRRYEHLDPNDRSPNSPGVMASSTRIKALFNQANPQDKADNVSQRVREWFEAESLNQGWDQVEWVGNEALLRKEFASDTKGSKS
jgi:hypothetical protein